MRLQMRYGFEKCEPFHIVCSADVPRTIGVIKVRQMVAQAVHLVGIDSLAFHLHNTMLLNACRRRAQRQGSLYKNEGQADQG